MIDLVLKNSRILHRRVTGEAMSPVDLKIEALCKMGMSFRQRKELKDQKWKKIFN